jgi:hypothetical protein
MFSNILIFLLSLSFFVSPAMVYESDHHQLVEMNCCVVETHSCHDSQNENQHKKQKQNDCNDTSCPMSNCHVQTLVLQLILEKTTPTNETSVFLKKTTNSHYSSLILKELIYSFWHPPKYIS